MEKQTLVKMIRVFTAALEALEQYELDQLLEGKGKFVFEGIDKQNLKITKPGKKAEHDFGNPDEILQRLEECGDREKARAILKSIANKEGLCALAKMLKIHVAKQDRRPDIENKIIEFVIGEKLRAAAINSLDLTPRTREEKQI